jgi:hypothetical protein
MAWHVMCRVSGVTGTRKALLKDGDSIRPKVFATREDAEGLMRWGNGSGSARFDYWAVPA